MTKSIPDGYHAVTPSLTLKNSEKALEFYQKAFGAKVLDTFPNPNGPGITHAVMQVGDSIIMMGDEMPGPNFPRSAETLAASPISLYLYVSDVDAVFKQAVAAGGMVIMPVEEMFWGDRAGTIKDPFGYSWMIATHKRDLTKDEVLAGAKVFYTKAA